MAAGLSAAATTAARAAVPEQAGPFWPGDLISMNNADFEENTGGWNMISNVLALTTSTDAFLHSHSLEIVAAGGGTSVIQLSGTSGIRIPVNPGGTYRVGAYIKMPATPGPATPGQEEAEFDLGCYGSAGKWLRWALGTPVAGNGGGQWQWVEDDITLPAGCTHVQGSPRVQFTGMRTGAVINMDEVWFAPLRAALMIGAYVQTGSSSAPASRWQSDDASIGPLQSDKVFFGGNSRALPATWDSPHNPCHAITQGNDTLPQPPACVINLKPPLDSSGQPLYSEAQIRDFLAGMPANETVIMVYHGEAENTSSGTFSGCSGNSDAAKFISCFEDEAGNIRTAAKRANRTENVFTADDAASSQYDAGGVAGTCNWIVPPGSVDFYFQDHYERGWANGTPLAQQSGSPNGQQQWNTWLSCVRTLGQGKPIGLAEYGLCSGGANCNKGSTSCADAGSTTDDTNTMTADNAYLASEPSGNSPTLLWQYWYANCWRFTDTAETNEWRSIESEDSQ